MDGDELLELLKRHKKTLKSLRLRHILLRRNSIGWRQILQFIRREISSKPRRGSDYWVSLRGIDYEDDIHAANGMHFVNGPAQNNTISDEDSDLDDLSETWSESMDEVDDEDEDSDENASNTVVGEQNESEQDELDESTDESHESLESHDEVDENENDLARDFPNVSIVETTPLPTPLSCDCANGWGWNDLDDDGNIVTRSQRKRWEKWVVKHCPKCDPPLIEDS
jgi:hypothetical protein